MEKDKKSILDKLDISLLAKVYVPIVAIVAIATLGLTMIFGSKMIYSSFIETCNTKADETRDLVKKAVYDYAEAQNHVKNRISVEITDAYNTAKLEVLEVEDVEYIIDEIDEFNKKITSWLKVTGKGVFTIDLDSAQFNYDENRETLNIILPRPELTYCTIIQGEKVLFQNDSIFEDTTIIKDGEDLAAKQITDGYIAIKDYFTSNERFLKTAKNQGEIIVTNVIQKLYSSIPNLNVLIEYEQ